MRTLGFILGIVLCVIARLHEIKAQRKLATFSDIKEIHNPIPKLWCWVSMNIIAQVINIVKTFIFAFDSNLECQYDKNV